MAIEIETTEHLSEDEKGKHRYKRTILKNRKNFKIPFCLMMLNDLGRLYDLQDNQIKVLLKIVSNMDYDNIVRVTGYDRKEWSRDLGITHQTINVAISKLKSAGIILSKGNGAYQIDPEVFHMGSVSESLERTESYNAYFKISYKNNKNGISRKVKMFKIDYEDIDVNDGENKKRWQSSVF